MLRAGMLRVSEYDHLHLGKCENDPTGVIAMSALLRA